MLHTTLSASEKRRVLRSRVADAGVLSLPGAFSPLSAMLIEARGFEAIYLSGAVLAADLGLPDVGLTSVSEVTGRAAQIARVTDLPVLVDADTGFGGAMNVARTVQLMEDAGVAGMHLEDQVNPKRCGHLDGKSVVETAEACRKIAAAVGARRDKDFLLVARTDARAIEGLDGAIERARAYVAAGADAIFVEALTSAEEFATLRRELDVPLLANMTEFGKGPALSVGELDALGVNMVIFPVSLLRLAMGAASEGLDELAHSGSFAGLLERMQTRSQLYDLLDYEGYSAFDDSVFNFDV